MALGKLVEKLALARIVHIVGFSIHVKYLTWLREVESSFKLKGEYLLRPWPQGLLIS